MVFLCNLFLLLHSLLDALLEQFGIVGGLVECVLEHADLLADGVCIAELGSFLRDGRCRLPDLRECITFPLVHVLELYGFAFVDSSFHLADELFLLLTEIFKTQLHTMDLLLEFLEFTLPDIGVESLLHLTFELDLAFPEQDMLLTLNDLIEEVRFTLLQLIDFDFETDTLLLQLFQLLLEFIFNVEVLVIQLLLLG